MALRWPLGLRARARRSTGAPHHPPAAPAPPNGAAGPPAAPAPPNGAAGPPATHALPDGAVNGHDVLARVVALPVSTWRYRNDGGHVWHLGPMAQDWWAAFGLGGTDKAIHCIDANGVALVAIQALHREVESLRAELRRLRGSSG